MEKSSTPNQPYVSPNQSSRLKGAMAGSTEGHERETEKVPRFDTEEIFHNDFDGGKTGARQPDQGDEFGRHGSHRSSPMTRERSELLDRQSETNTHLNARSTAMNPTKDSQFNRDAKKPLNTDLNADRQKQLKEVDSSHQSAGNAVKGRDFDEEKYSTRELSGKDAELEEDEDTELEADIDADSAPYTNESTGGVREFGKDQERELNQNDKGRTAQDKPGISKNANDFGKDQRQPRH